MIDLSMHKEVLLSVINTRLRNEYPSLEALCTAFEIDLIALQETLKEIDYVYESKSNQFKHISTL